MDELIKTANIYYKSCSPAMRDAAHKFFKAIDHDNDGRVCLHEFLGFMRDEGHTKMSSRHFFKSLDRNGSGTLDFMGVMALYYIIQSGRPFCYGCDDFIPGMYFTCSKCYQNSQNAICLCPECFATGTYTHEHKNFLDNYALLEVKRMQGIATHSIHQHQVKVL
ncbi:hypothetical protein RHMOL_Rhmol09G0019900 [Rhododendron molle]|uniref:Uncharacterized protein n=1 Tax=Rhododendron molle TaxID=49168 RepID=A0ACC0M9Z9_RHOML|nr:hypothetical protein RHMOL_Rhmol09G0019900 [Rhododendron molle]